MRCRFALASDVGRIRANNEDSVSALPDLGLFAVADGMGGHVAGEFASRLALETLVEVVRKREKPRRIRDIGPLLCEAILAANSAVYREAETRGLLGMGTTLTALYVRGRTGVVGHVDQAGILGREPGIEREEGLPIAVALFLQLSQQLGGPGPGGRSDHHAHLGDLERPGVGGAAVGAGVGATGCAVMVTTTFAVTHTTRAGLAHT